MTYEQATGNLFAADGTLMGVGHAGNGTGWNNPADQFQHNVGPLPVGHYKIGAWGTHAQLGPISAPLTPQPDESGGYAWLHGRGGFYCHGPVFSEGCIVQEEPVRLAASKSGDTDMFVISGLPPEPIT